MPFVITWFQNEGVEETRARVRPVHLEYLDANVHRIITSGGLSSDADQPFTGGMVVVDTDVKQEAIDLIEHDPFFINGIFSRYTINYWKKFIFDHKRLY